MNLFFLLLGEVQIHCECNTRVLLTPRCISMQRRISEKEKKKGLKILDVRIVFT